MGDYRALIQAQDQTWQAQITEGDRSRVVDRSLLDPVPHKDRSAIYTAYVTRPERLAPEARFPLFPATEKVKTIQQITWQGQPALYVAFDNGVPVRELWLDPVRWLPLRIHWVDSGVYGRADIFMDFAPFEDLWLPTQALTEINLNFWIPQGLGRKVFNGPLTIRTTYENYQRDAAGPLPVVAEPTPIPTTPTAGATDLAPVTTPSTSGTFDLKLSDQQSTSLIADRIRAFNLSKPEVVSPYTYIHILLTLTWANSSWQTYLLRFQTKEPFLEVAPAAATDFRRIRD